MGTEGRRLLLLGALVVVLVLVIYRVWPSTSGGPVVASNRQGPRGGPGGAAQGATPVAPDVHLEALESERPKPSPAERDLFRFKPKAPPPSAVRPSPGTAPALPTVPSGPPPPPAVPPITLKFIGVMESPEKGQKIAVLTDGRGAPFYGREGEIVEGRYRILKIGVESIEIAYADGSGRQTIRLTGQ